MARNAGDKPNSFHIVSLCQEGVKTRLVIRKAMDLLLGPLKLMPVKALTLKVPDPAPLVWAKFVVPKIRLETGGRPGRTVRSTDGACHVQSSSQHTGL